MTERVEYHFGDGIAWLRLDDGKVNVMSPDMQAELHGALDRAEADDAVVVLQGRDGVFSAGFDLEVLGRGDEDSVQMVIGGFELAERVLAYPRPVVVACTGHAIAMGAFLLCSGDYRVGTSAPARYVANEVAIGLTVPRAATEILRSRLTPSAFQRAVLLAHVFGPHDAVAAGFLDEVIAPDELDRRVAAIATTMTSLDRAAHRATKQRTRNTLIEAIGAAIDADRSDLAALVAGAPSGR